MSRDIVLLQGYPGSGKSSAATQLAETYNNPDYDQLAHYSVGNHLRGIINGTIESTQTAHILEQSEVLAVSQRLDDHVVNEVVKEHLATLPARSITLIDAYPLYVDQIPEFQRNVTELSAKVLGVVEIEIDPKIAFGRIIQRGTRTHEDHADVAFAQRRIDEHTTDCLPTTVALGRIYPTLHIDGSRTSSEVVTLLDEAIDILAARETGIQ